MTGRTQVNALTVDVEDFFHVQAFADVIPRDSWDGLPRRVEQNTERLLELCARAGVAGTFFTLGWVAQRHSALIRRIVAAGHELASHGFGHQRVETLTPEAFRDDIVRAKRLLEDTGGVAVAGYRAPTFSLGPRTPWAFKILADAGYRYSSSVYPVRHDLYGSPDAPRGPYRHDGTKLWEFPMTTLRVASKNLPCSGGGYFRLLPYPLYRLLLRRCNAAQRAPALFYTHPWEIDPDQPRVAGAGRLSRFRHYNNLAKTFPRLERLLRDFAWDRMDRVYAEHLERNNYPPITQIREGLSADDAEGHG
jgi:polysaccharide deacetylase family protein (PEP-CTERM system associated)